MATATMATTGPRRRLDVGPTGVHVGGSEGPGSADGKVGGPVGGVSPPGGGHDAGRSGGTQLTAGTLTGGCRTPRSGLATSEAVKDLRRRGVKAVMRPSATAEGRAEIDPATMAQAAAGDPVAFARLVAHYDPRLRAIAWRLLGDRSAMDDALQETYVRAHRSIAGFRHGAAPGTWLHRITYNVCIDELRRRHRRPTSPFDEAVAAADPGPALDAVVAERSSLALALATLPPEQRAAVLLVDAQGYDYTAAGEVLGIPAGTVASRLSRARATLRLALTDDDHGGQR